MKLFDSISIGKPKKNKFDLSHEKKLSLNMGELVPIFLQEIVPGDSFKVNTEILMRLQPLQAPMMHRVNVFTHYFFVPNRLVWDEWEQFITGGKEGSAVPVAPHILVNDSTKSYFEPGELADYLGVPPFNTIPLAQQTVKISGLPFRAYATIFNEYYRDQNLFDEINTLKTSGQMQTAELDAVMQLRVRSWEKDYFTSALPWAQKGGAVSIPNTGDLKFPARGTLADGVTGAPAGALQTNSAGSVTVGGTTEISIDGLEGVNLTVNDLRRSVRLQEWLERNARGGSRYIEQILSHFGVLSSDARLQRPEYLGGGKNPVVISEVLSTFQQADDLGYPQGNMTGHGISVGNIHGFKRSFEEHGYVIGIMSVMPKTAYQQGIPRHFSRMDKFDYYWPTFANLGEQEIKNKEIYADLGAAAIPGETLEDTFGYQSRYAEYKYQESTVHGDFRGNLAFWHMGRIFTAAPKLNANFVFADPTKRVFAVEDPDQDSLLCQIYHRVDALRPMPYYGTPQL